LFSPGSVGAWPCSTVNGGCQRSSKIVFGSRIVEDRGRTATSGKGQNGPENRARHGRNDNNSLFHFIHINRRMDSNRQEESAQGAANGSGKSGCSEDVLKAIYGSGQDKKQAYENSLRR